MPTASPDYSTLRRAWYRDVLAAADEPFVTFPEYCDRVGRAERAERAAQEILSIAPEPVCRPPHAPRPKPRAKPKTIANLKRPTPQYLIGFEFEGMIRSDIKDNFRYYLQDFAYGSDAKSLIQWGSDSSIHSIPFGYESVEFRTKPLALKPGIELLEWVLSYLYLASQTQDFLTNESCGFHMNISERNVFQGRRQIPLYAHVLARFDEMRVLERFGRDNNHFCFSFADTITVEGIDPKNPIEVARFFREHYNHDPDDKKYFSVALRDSPRSWSNRLKNHRIEFRGMGNTDYHLRHDDLKTSINDMIEAVKLSVKEVSVGLKPHAEPCV